MVVISEAALRGSVGRVADSAWCWGVGEEEAVRGGKEVDECWLGLAFETRGVRLAGCGDLLR